MTDEIRAADLAKALGVSPREARVKLRAAGFRAPYKSSDVPKMKAVIKAPVPDKRLKGDKPKAATPKPAAKPKKAAPTLPAVKLDTAAEAPTIN